MPNTAEQKAFYNSLLPKLAAENPRHERVYKSLDSLPKGRTLDLGCGAGLTSKRLADGGRDVVAVDFSPVLIKYASKFNSNERIKYICSDVREVPTDGKFDVICLVDVLEHINGDAWKLMDVIDNASHDATVIYLNIPYANCIKYLRTNRPELLQPIDQAREIKDILNRFEGIGFVPYQIELYWMQYIEYFFCTRNQFKMFMDEAYKNGRE